MLTGFTAGLLLITLSELGDKTFFIGALLAMRHSRRWVFIGVTAALFAMTV
ncbi:MAG: TMEM165/GDT1 family protein, partial [Cyanobacteria bacterium P01_D01_bin.128]